MIVVNWERYFGGGGIILKLGQEPVRIERQLPLQNIWLLEHLRQEPLLMALRPDLRSLPMYRIKPTAAKSTIEKDDFMNSDFLDLLRTFVKYNVSFLIIGGYAAAIHGHVRYTKDLDLWVKPSPENARNVRLAMVAFGWPNPPSEEDLMIADQLAQAGVIPTAIDVFTGIGGLDFDDCYKAAIGVQVEGMNLKALSLHDLIAAKRISGRPQDLADIHVLSEIAREK